MRTDLCLMVWRIEPSVSGGSENRAVLRTTANQVGAVRAAAFACGAGPMHPGLGEVRLAAEGLTVGFRGPVAVPLGGEAGAILHAHLRVGRLQPGRRAQRRQRGVVFPLFAAASCREKTSRPPCWEQLDDFAASPARPAGIAAAPRAPAQSVPGRGRVGVLPHRLFQQRHGLPRLPFGQQLPRMRVSRTRQPDSKPEQSFNNGIGPGRIVGQVGEEALLGLRRRGLAESFVGAQPQGAGLLASRRSGRRPSRDDAGTPASPDAAPPPAPAAGGRAARPASMAENRLELLRSLLHPSLLQKDLAQAEPGQRPAAVASIALRKGAMASAGTGPSRRIRAEVGPMGVVGVEALRLGVAEQRLGVESGSVQSAGQQSPVLRRAGLLLTASRAS